MSSLFFDCGEQAKGQKVCLATISYDDPDAGYTFSLQSSREALHKAGIGTAYMLLTNDCHVDDARNSVVSEFLATDCTDLVFLDADVSWEPEALVRLCRHDRDIVGGVYPYRRKGAWGMPVILDDEHRPEPDGLLPVKGLPTGFLRIRRGVFEVLCKSAVHHCGRGDLVMPVPILFERTYAEGKRWGGDISFCRKWAAAGGKLYADPEIRLGHTGKVTMYDSLGAFIRRNANLTLRYVVERLRQGSQDLSLLSEAFAYVGNPFGAPEEVLAPAAFLARNATGPIIEAGSGLTTVLMAAFDQPVYCLEHDEIWALRLEAMVREAGVMNVRICRCPLVDGWYSTEGLDLPRHFAIGLVDGPPRALGDRRRFFDRFGKRCDTIIVDDADSPAYAGWIALWAKERGLASHRIEERGMIVRNEKEEPCHSVLRG